jgi:hypothetical protein
MRYAIKDPIVKTVSTVVTQTAHGFSAGTPLYFTGTQYAAARADDENKSEVLGIISSVLDANRFEMVQSGEIKVLGASFLAGNVGFLDAAGGITFTPLNVVGQVSKPLMTATSATTGTVNILRGVTIGGANALRSCGLQNGITTVIDLGAYEFAWITGKIKNTATTEDNQSVFLMITKRATDFAIYSLESGDETLVSFDVTAGGILQATLSTSDHPGWIATTFNYQIMGAPVGITLPVVTPTITTMTTSGGISPSNDPHLIVFNSSSALAISVSTSVGNTGKRLNMKNIGTGQVTLDFNGVENLEGNLTTTMNMNEFTELTAYNGNWIVTK